MIKEIPKIIKSFGQGGLMGTLKNIFTVQSSKQLAIETIKQAVIKTAEQTDSYTGYSKCFIRWNYEFINFFSRSGWL